MEDVDNIISILKLNCCEIFIIINFIFSAIWDYENKICKHMTDISYY